MNKPILIVGGGIGGLCLGIALRRHGAEVELIEISRDWNVYGTGIIQQANVVRAMAQLGIVDEFLAAGFAYDCTRAYDRAGHLQAEIAVPRLAGHDYPAMLGISRPALQQVLRTAATKAGVCIRSGVTLSTLQQHEAQVHVACTDGTEGDYALVVGADGLYSRVRAMVFGESFQPTYTGQAVWRYNLPRPAEIDCLATQIGADSNAGVCPISQDTMYLFLTSSEPGNPRMPEPQLAALMRERLQGYGGFIARFRDQITDPAQVVYRPLETVLVPPPWHRGRVALIGDAAHGATPHLGQGAGMAIEDAVVLAEEVCANPDLQQALQRYIERRWERARFIWETSVGICMAELAGRTDIDRPGLLRKMFEVTSQPI